MSAVDVVTVHLRMVLLNRPFLLLGVARNQLLTESLATDPDNPVLRELAAKLHRHQIGAVKFVPGITREEMVDLLHELSSDSRLDPVGLRLRDFESKWESVRLFPPAYDRIELAEDGSSRTGGAMSMRDTAGGRLWMGLAAATLIDLGATELMADPQAIAEAINKADRDPALANRVVQYLLGLSRELRLAHAAEAAMIRERLGALLNHLTPEALKDLASRGADLAQRRRLVQDAAMMLPAGAALALLRAASDGTSQTIPGAMLRMLNKLAFQAEKGSLTVREEADLAMRESIRQLVDKWELADPNPERYSRLLEKLARHPTGARESKEEHPSEAYRVVEMSLETDTVGETVWGALEAMVMAGEATRVVEMVKDPRVAEDIQEQFWIHLATATNMRVLLNNEPRDTEVVEVLLERMGMAAAEPMLESLEVAENRAMRSRLLNRLKGLGTAIGPMLVQRLEAAPWYVQRNLLALLSSLPEIPAEFSLAPYANHEDGRVRREALKLQLRIPGQRNDAVHALLGEQDDVNLRLGLAAALEGCPPSAVSRLMGLLNDRRLGAEVHAMAIRVLGTIRTPATRDWLIDHALTRARWFRPRRLVPRSPELIAVIATITRSFARDPQAQLVIRLALASNDGAIRRAASGALEQEAPAEQEELANE
ncbi:MAG: hypothetical protein OEV95_04250 [Gemmatimonadota bacterium]|nr:hypothetical protein [Gemmatimonadota bacterium]MDH5284425.1 hypothetical protein [Gemmatimonadota bacterium]